MEKSLNNTLDSVSDWINFDYFEWAKIQAHSDDAESIKEAGHYLIETMIKATNAEETITTEKKKINRISRKKEGHDTYKKTEKATEEGDLSFLYEMNTNNQSQDFLFYDSVIKKEIAQSAIESGKLKLVPKKLHQSQYFKAWTPNTH